MKIVIKGKTGTAMAAFNYLSDEDLPPSLLMNATLGKRHRRFVDTGKNQRVALDLAVSLRFYLQDDKVDFCYRRRCFFFG